ncbi:Checkpoint protein hus1 [Coemansia sp. RSA 2523]|nr:Checkpoint protein hus1 [Coemansia sp. RSA 1824]KAJ1805725.1 Checkpoint protein hus1 [Coemansia sp. RSA 2523]KAJ2168242.1 Checkpoint protein hus1 [Coemansia sp. RSA 562]KAJ2188808.1 Checkpoint protein hus1 [Coemansia sp. RSA 532]KAJ2197971.1 Checkpoint protein hus1 [Coemansia sp. RSA 522]KAJ2274971.1 Checkpoint protein hus1 [Coemansia sp. RSA 451]KAJ2277316.1 Checkpoint protein hus1 [Coemansia sp. RSA 371]KAJ2282489.1 Checkpoint protein hus1 [Coemansia sp. RSA 370]KAJ2293731.1 Checkpoint
MRFRAQVTNSSLLVRIVQCIERLSKTAVLKLTPTRLHIIVVSDTEGGLQMWSDVDPQALFASYRVESLHNNEIHLEFHIDNLQRALRSAHNSQSAVLKLTKKQNLPVLSLSVQSMSSTGHTTLVCQDVPVRVLTPEQVRAMREPEVPDAHVHIMMPELSTIRSVVERMRLMGDRVTVAANNEGQLTLRVASDRVDITTYWRGLANMTYDASEQPQAHEFSVATVDMRNFCRFLHSYHVAPKNVICAILEHHALVFYVYIGEASSANIDEQSCGSLTYYLPVRQV